MVVKGVVQSLSTHLNEVHLTTELGRTLRQDFLSNSLPISPRRADQISQEVSAAFLEFLGSEDEEAARTCGQRLAAEGLGHRSILTMTETLRQVCWESDNPVTLSPAAGRYVTAVLEGYMASREASLLQEQTRTMHAFQRAQKRQDQ